MEIRDKVVLVYGTGRSGKGAAELLVNMGAKPVFYDENELLDKKALKDSIKSFSLDIDKDVYVGELSDELLSSAGLAVLSPGVPTDCANVLRIKSFGIPVIGELELAYRASRGRVLAVTGTNGKTTTVSLLGKICKDYYKDAKIVGNIGNSYADAAFETTDDSCIVAEVSSFQLETIDEFHPLVSAITNITEDHLDRHHTMEEYIRAKELITKNQTKDEWCVLNYEDEVLRKFGESLDINVCFFSSARRLERGIYLDGEMIKYNFDGDTVELISTRSTQLLGLHNYENIMVASAMAILAGVPSESVRVSVKEFKPVEHRIEFVGEVGGVAYYNDSKGTNPDAAIKGIKAMERPTYLIAGGYDKGACYDEWINSFEGKVKELVLIGQTKEKIKNAAAMLGFNDSVLLENLEEAVKYCAKNAQVGDAVLLSPACASWGQFDNFEQRGDMFKEFVASL